MLTFHEAACAASCAASCAHTKVAQLVPTATAWHDKTDDSK
jgi:hypothetical protein